MFGPVCLHWGRTFLDLDPGWGLLGEKLRLRENRQVWFVIDLFTHSHSHCAQFIHLSQYKIALIETRTHYKDTREMMAPDLCLATENVEQVSIHL